MLSILYSLLFTDFISYVAFVLLFLIDVMSKRYCQILVHGFYSLLFLLIIFSDELFFFSFFFYF